MAAKKKSGAKKKTSSRPKAAPAPKSAKPLLAPSQFFTAEGGPWGQCFLPRAAGERRYWLVKSEPDVFSWDDLMAAPKRTTHWNGVRNYSARNFMRDGMALGDLVFYYHSNDNPQAIQGICEVVREGYPDPTQFDSTQDGYDENAKAGAPIWYMVDLRAVAPLAVPVTLPMMKAAKALAQMALIRTGRLSVIPVTVAEWEAIVAMGRG